MRIVEMCWLVISFRGKITCKKKFSMQSKVGVQIDRKGHMKEKIYDEHGIYLLWSFKEGAHVVNKFANRWL